MPSARDLVNKAIVVNQQYDNRSPDYETVVEPVEYGWAQGVIDLANAASDFRVEGAYNERESIVHWLRELARIQKGSEKGNAKLLHTLAGRIERADHLEINRPKAVPVETVQRPATFQPVQDEASVDPDWERERAS